MNFVEEPLEILLQLTQFLERKGGFLSEVLRVFGRKWELFGVIYGSRPQLKEMEERGFSIRLLLRG